MKTRDLYVLGVVLMISLLVIFLVLIPVLWWFDYVYLSAFIVVCFGSVGIVLYVCNAPGYYMGRFHTHDDEEIKIQKSNTQQYNYHRSVYSFSCGHANIQMVLERYGVMMTQDQILKIAGDKKLGMMPWEIKETLNDIFLKKGIAAKARISYFTTYAQLFDAVQKGKAVIVMFVNHFSEEGYSLYANYPHFAVLNKITMNAKKEKNRVILTSPTFATNGNKNYTLGRNPGEIIIPLEEFQERFYATTEHFHNVESKPTKNLKRLRTGWHKFLNFLFVFGLYIGYCIRIVKPGLSIIVESVEKK
jgi:hypothetical protein